MQRLLLIGAGLLAIGALAVAAVLVVSDRSLTPEPSFAGATTSGTLPAIPQGPAGTPALLKPYVGDKDSIIERYRPAFHAMGYEIGIDRTGVVGDKILYHWWAQRRFEQAAMLPRIGDSGFRANPYGQRESEAAVKKLLEQVKSAEGRQ